MGSVKDKGDSAFRDFETDGVPASGPHDPVKGEVREVFAEVDNQLAILGAAGGGLVFDSKAALDADLDHAEHVRAEVIGDSPNDGIYMKSGAEGAGAWEKLADIGEAGLMAHGLTGIDAMIDSLAGDGATSLAGLLADFDTLTLTSAADQVAADLSDFQTLIDEAEDTLAAQKSAAESTMAGQVAEVTAAGTAAKSSIAGQVAGVVGYGGTIKAGMDAELAAVETKGTITRQQLADLAAQLLEANKHHLIAISNASILTLQGMVIMAESLADDQIAAAAQVLQTIAPLRVFTTTAALLADLTPADGVVAIALDTGKIYVKVGATGTGSWATSAGILFSKTSVGQHGALADKGATENLPFFTAAAASAGSANRTVEIMPGGEPGDWYGLTGLVPGAEAIDWRWHPDAEVRGWTGPLGRQRRLAGAAWYDPTVTRETIADLAGTGWIGRPDVTAAWGKRYAAFLRNAVNAGADQASQEAVLAVQTYGGAWGAAAAPWSEVATATNPWDAIDEGEIVARARLLYLGDAPDLEVDQLWLVWSCYASTAHGLILSKLPSAAGAWTNQFFWQAETSGALVMTTDQVAPVDHTATWHLDGIEFYPYRIGRPFVAHDGQVCQPICLVERGPAFAVARKRAVVIHTADQGNSWTIGPRILDGALAAADLVEIRVAQIAPGAYRAFGLTQDGRHVTALSADGRSFGAWQAAPIVGPDVADPRRASHVHFMQARRDAPSGDSNVALHLQRNGVVPVPGPSLSAETAANGSSGVLVADPAAHVDLAEGEFLAVWTEEDEADDSGGATRLRIARVATPPATGSLNVMPRAAAAYALGASHVPTWDAETGSVSIAGSASVSIDAPAEDLLLSLKVTPSALPAEDAAAVLLVAGQEGLDWLQTDLATDGGQTRIATRRITAASGTTLAGAGDLLAGGGRAVAVTLRYSGTTGALSVNGSAPSFCPGGFGLRVGDGWLAGAQPTGTTLTLALADLAVKAWGDEVEGIEPASLQAIAEVAGAPAVSVGAVGGKADGATANFPYVYNAIATAIQSGVLRVYFGPGTWRLDGDFYPHFPELHRVEFVLHPEANVVGLHDLMFAQDFIEGMSWLSPAVSIVEAYPMQGEYNHQELIEADLLGDVALGDSSTDSDARLVLQRQRNLTTPVESDPAREVVLQYSTDATGAVWGDDVDPFHSVASSNPVAQDAYLIVGPGLFNFERHGLGKRFWASMAMVRGTAGPFVTVAQKTCRDGAWTNYSLYQSTDDPRLARWFLGKDKTAPAGYSTTWTAGGMTDLAFQAQDHLVTSRGRLLVWGLMIPRFGPFREVARYPVVLYCDDPSADITAMDFRVGPLIPNGECPPNGFSEIALWEESPDFFVALARRNDLLATVTEQEGLKQYIAFGDGVHFPGGFRRSGHSFPNLRPQGFRLNHRWSAYIQSDDPGGRRNAAVSIKIRDGAIASGISVSNEANQSTKRQDLRSDDLSQFLLTFDDLPAFTEGAFRLRRYGPDGSYGWLTDSGYVPAYDDDEVTLQQLDDLPDTFVAEQGREEVLFELSDEGDTLAFPWDLTTATPEAYKVRRSDGSILDLSAGDVTFLTGSDEAISALDPADWAELYVTQRGLRDTLYRLSPGDTIQTTSLDISQPGFELWSRDGSGNETPVAEAGFKIVNTASNIVQVYQREANDRFAGFLYKGDRLQLPYGMVHPTTRDLFVAYAIQDGAGVLGEGLYVARIQNSGWADPGKLPLIPTKRPANAFDNAAHYPSDDGAITSFPGSAAASSPLPAGAWQVAYPWRLLTDLAGAGALVLFSVGNFEQLVTATIRKVSATGRYLIEVYVLHQGVGFRDTSRPEARFRQEIEAAVGAWLTMPVRWDSRHEQVTIFGETFKLAWPYLLFFGDFLLFNDEQSTSQVWQVDRSAVTLTRLPAEHREWTRSEARPAPVNFMLDPELRLDPLNDGGTYAGSPGIMMLPPWICVDDGDAAVTMKLTRNSYAASIDRGGFRYSATITCSGTSVRPVRIGYPWPGIDALTGEPWGVGLYIENLREVEPGEAELDLPIALKFQQDFGRGGKRIVTPLGTDRKAAVRSPVWLPIQVPSLRENAINAVGEGEHCMLIFEIAAGYEFELRITRPMVAESEAPVSWTRKHPYAPDLMRRVVHKVAPGKVGQPIAQCRALSNTSVEVLLDLPDMIEAPDDVIAKGAFGVLLGSDTLAGGSGRPVLVDATEDRAWLRLSSLSANTLMEEGDVGWLVGLTPKTETFAGDDASVFFQTEIRADQEDDLLVYKGTTPLTWPTDYLVNASWAKPVVERPAQTLGDSIFQLASDVKTGREPLVEVGVWTDAAGYTVLPASYAEVIPVGEAGTPAEVHLLDGAGSPVGLGAGQELICTFDFRAGAGASVNLNQKLTSGETLSVVAAEESGNALIFNAGIGRARNMIQAATSAFVAAFSVAPAVKVRDGFDEWVTTLIDAGIWATGGLAYVHGCHDDQASRVNLLNPGSYTLTANNGVLFKPYSGRAYLNGAAYDDSGADVASNVPHFTQNDAELAFWLVSAKPTSGSCWLNGPINCSVRPLSQSGTRTISSRLNAGTIQTVKSTYQDGDAQGYTGVSRNNGANYQVIQAESPTKLREQTVTQASAAVASGTFVLGYRGVASTNFLGELFISWIGGRLTPLQRTIFNRAAIRLREVFGSMPR